MNQEEREILLQRIEAANARCLAVEKELEAAKKKISEYEELAKKAEKAASKKAAAVSAPASQAPAAQAPAAQPSAGQTVTE